MRRAPAAAALLSESQLATLRRRSDIAGIALVASAWALIAGAMTLFAWWPNPLTFVVAVMVIGSRQLGLLILMHDGAHGMLSRRPVLNRVLSQGFCAWPTFADTDVYRRYHLKHHARTMQDDDPDLVLTGHYPISRASLRRKLWRDLSGQTGYAQRRAQVGGALGAGDRPLAQRLQRFGAQLGRPLAVNGVLLAVLALAGYWYLYPLLWLLPLLTWQQVVLRVRNIAEHAAVPDRDDPFRSARTTRANWLERLLIAPFWVNYHLEHHLLMWVPCYRLPQARRYLLANGYGSRMLDAAGYGALLREVTFEGPDGPRGRRRATGTFSDGFDAV